MATFQTLQNDVLFQAGLDFSNTDNLNNAKRWLNVTQQDICGRWPWAFLLSREVITTSPDYAVGTVSVAAGGTTVTGVGMNWNSAYGTGPYFIKFAGFNDWYNITAFTNSTSITIEMGYTGSTGLTAVGYIIRQWYYSLSANADRIIEILNRNTPLKMFETDVRTLDSVSPNPSSTNSSYAFVGYGYDASGNIRITPYPFPSDSRLLEIKTLKRVNDLVNNSDVSIIPVKWHHILTMGACAWAFMFKQRPEIAQVWNAEYEKKISDMMAQARTSEDEAPVLKSIDSVARGTFVTLPGNYPIVGGR